MLSNQKKRLGAGDGHSTKDAALGTPCPILQCLVGVLALLETQLPAGTPLREQPMMTQVFGLLATHKRLNRVTGFWLHTS